MFLVVLFIKSPPESVYIRACPSSLIQECQTMPLRGHLHDPVGLTADRRGNHGRPGERQCQLAVREAGAEGARETERLVWFHG